MPKFCVVCNYKMENCVCNAQPGGMTEPGLTPRKLMEHAQEDIRTLIDKMEGVDYMGVATLDYTQERIRKAMYHAAVEFTREMCEVIKDLHNLEEWEA